MTGIRIEQSSTKTALIAYVDVTLLVTSPSEIPGINSTTDQFGAASTVQINIERFKAIAVGAWNTPANIMCIPYPTQMKILGILYTKTITQSA